MKARQWKAWATVNKRYALQFVTTKKRDAEEFCFEDGDKVLRVVITESPRGK